MKEKLLLVGVDTSTRFALEYARSIGVHTIVTDYIPPEKSPAKRLADEYWMIDVFDIDALEERCRKESVTGIYAGNHEFCLDIVKELTKRLGLPFYASDEGWICSRDKSVFKEYCQNAGIDVPKRYMVHEPITPEMLDEMDFPVIVKPVDACASRGISVCSSRDEVEAAYQYALQFSETKNIIVEDYICGDVLAVNFYIHEGKAHLTHTNLVVAAKEGGNPTNSGSAIARHKGYTRFIRDQLSDKFQNLFSSMNCQNGSIFVQGIPCNGKLYVFEMGYRLDGICDFTVTKPLFGFSALEAMVDLALGRKPKYNGETCLSGENERVGILFLVWGKPGKISRIVSEDVRSMEGVQIVLDRFKVGDEIRETKNLLQVPFYLSVIADNRTEMIEKIKRIDSTLKVLDENGNNLLVPFERLDELYEVLA